MEAQTFVYEISPRYKQFLSKCSKEDLNRELAAIKGNDTYFDQFTAAAKAKVDYILSLLQN